ncbi:folate-binding protein [Buchnera aphidicola str. Ak (Acyrthosiphon kondoi)]|uniref:tRNA-modifying protein YgfZ n=1 Tax=Buchnera aphidicola str. Ak (Acyrthosiphon kondoi) TaxID=1005090 RepID=G2LND5_9GAMM|nr:tRNA-modifying protein YgfZ [Buchnera aphidicola]AEO08773.1 folate-binding protein [Buchnera aphidicola str. Ak (Acyrthosiphon kondoi)]
MSSFISSQNIVYPSNELSPTMILLEEWSLIYVEGFDSKTYLQSQLTIDMNLLPKTHHTLCAHCNFNGKVLSVMHLFHYRKGYGYIQRKSTSKVQIKEIRKYSIFSKIKIYELNDICLIGFTGLNVRSFLLSFFIKIPDKNCPVIHENNKTILWYAEPSERFLLVLSFSDFLNLKRQINKNIFLNNNQQWLLLDIEAGFPIIDKICSQRFTPQAINLDKLKAISFEKGCYYGQETIARIFFKKINKYFLSSFTSTGKISPEIGSFIETQINDKWCKIGVLLSVVYVKSKEIYIQAVLRKPVDVNNFFRICGFKNIFFIRN